ncbi:DNA-directed RNA polymerase subunit beta [Candidatus Borrelia fainii]|uniref:DNA-directed RNA polymerase subunit beta n=1 Tax=Candidatus Borrelia fainii TaxID=2518322 RepID=A0ABN6UT64_9SPIR|nr:DNA-directed RNA polymerase subunit beta [Candidatus Borrelia fainii]BDU62935.1 DNA-directed RNA polymerase subunit beta [Candidatus Borrelia fainii]
MIKRVHLGQGKAEEILDLPNLIEIQLNSYEKFLQLDRLKNNKPLLNEGLESVFRDVFPMKNSNGEVALEYEKYYVEYDSLSFTEKECKRKGQSYEAVLKIRLNLQFLTTGEIRQKDVYMGTIPLMTDRGTFIVNGAERVIVSQIHRSPGVVFYKEKDLYYARIIPYRGSWLEFELDSKKDYLYVKIDRKKRILVTLFLRALGLDTREKIIETFYKIKKIEVNEDIKREITGQYLAVNITIKENMTYRAGDKITLQDIEDFLQNGVKEIDLIDFDGYDSVPGKHFISSDVILNCFEKEDAYFSLKDGFKELSRESVMLAVYSVLLPGEPISIDNAENDLRTVFFSEKRYDLGHVGRYKLSKKFGINDLTTSVLTMTDIVNTISHILRIYDGHDVLDDIDHLGNRRVRSVGELLTNIYKGAMSRVEKIAKDRMSNKEVFNLKPQELISVKPIVSAVKEFFATSQLSQFMDQVNPLAELTHKRRLNALGPGGLSRDRAGFEVRDVHYTHYGRMCPIETPEGPNIGLIVSLATYAKVNDYGFLETPYRKVVNGKVTDEIEYLSAIDEEKKCIAQANAAVNTENNYIDDLISVRVSGDYTTMIPKNIDYMDVSPRQLISVSSALIPFLEHNDANRALMGSNMQRQAVPLLFPQPPIVGTGMERIVAKDSGVVIKAKRSGTVVLATSKRIVIRPDNADDEHDLDEYELAKYERTNQDTSFNHSVLIKEGQVVNKDEIIADGPATRYGELALGNNLLVGFIPWNGFNYEDAILISERIVKEDLYTSIHIKEFSIEVRETKLGPEKVTADIPNVSGKILNKLDENGIVRIGTYVKPGDILIGKVTPKSEGDITPEFKLLTSIFGEKAKDVKNNSLKVPHGTEGTVIDVQRITKDDVGNLPPGVDEILKVYVAKKRRLKEGDKMAGRHGNKGVVAKILPVEDMPYLADGTPLDICLNPLGVPSRMNIGQLMESQLGLAGKYLSEYYDVPVFESATNECIQEKLKKAGFNETSKAILYDGYTGEPFENEVMVGIIYMLKLHHLVDDKMHARSTGPYSLVSQQPLGGKAQFGGQRLGEMEVWALEAYGAAYTLQELLTVKSDDMSGRVKIYENIVKGIPTNVSGIPESFNVLMQELRGLGFDLSIYDDNGNQIPLTEKEEELINKT